MGGQIVLYADNRPRRSGFRLYGFVRDEETGELILGATVRSTLGGTVQTNEHGFFSLALPGGSRDTFRLFFAYPGYEVAERTFAALRQDTLIVERLRPISDSLGVLVVTAERARLYGGGGRPSLAELDGAQLRRGVSPLGPADAFQQFQQLPGVQGGVEGATGLYVRGGNLDQNLVLLDGAPLYNPYHLLGLVSVLPTSSINRISLHKGALPARFDGRTGSVLDVRLREGNAREWQGEMGLGPTLASAHVEGPILRDRTTVLLAARRSTVDWFTGLASLWATDLPRRKTDIGYSLFDLNGKLSHRFSERDQLTLSCYSGGEQYGYRSRDRLAGVQPATDSLDNDNRVDWSNLTASLSWRHTYHPRLFGNASFTFTRYRFRHFVLDARYADGGYALYHRSARTRIQDFAVAHDWKYTADNALTVRFGTQWTLHRFNVFQTVVYDEMPLADFGAFRDSLARNNLFLEIPSAWCLEGQLFAEAEWNLGRGWDLEAGFSATLFGTDSLYWGLMPRFVLGKAWAGGLRWTCSTGGANQYLHQPVSSTLILPSDLWVYASRGVLPQRSVQATTGLVYEGAENWRFSLEAYWKHLWSVAAQRPGARDLDDPAPNWRQSVIQGGGGGQGLECAVERTGGRLTGSLGYALSWAWRQFDELNGGRPFPFRFDRRHALNAQLHWQINGRLSVSAAWRFLSGSPTGGAVSLSPGISPEESPILLESVAAFRLPAVHRLDLALVYKKEKKQVDHLLQVGLFNAYNRINPAYARFSQNAFGDYRYSYVGFLPILPQVHWTMRFH